jgi:hypothetical protein
VGGCLSPVRTMARAELAGNKQESRNANETRICGGGDVMNVSPTVALSGGGGILMGVVMMGMMMVGWRRSRRTLRTMIGAIEKLEDGKDVKREISRAALAEGVADYLHGKVRKDGKK